MNKIISITEKVPQPTTLPDGVYLAVWGGYMIELKYDGKLYELKTEDGVRGININVFVTIANGVATFEPSKN